jgi:hypothetical protein
MPLAARTHLVDNTSLFRPDHIGCVMNAPQ